MVEYLVGKKDKSTTAYLNNMENMLVSEVAKAMNLKEVYGSMEEVVANVDTIDTFHLRPLKMKDHYEVTVTCREGDEYSEEAGKIIARCELLKKIAQVRDRKLNYWMSTITEYLDSLASHSNKTLFLDLVTRLTAGGLVEIQEETDEEDPDMPPIPWDDCNHDCDNCGHCTNGAEEALEAESEEC